MNIQRLQQAVKILRRIKITKTNKFDLAEWTCGTSACAIGHICRYKVIRDQGLLLIPTGTPNSLKPAFKGFHWDGIPILYMGWNAVEEFFELRGSEAEYLFARESYRCADESEEESGKSTTPEDVAERIERFIFENRLEN